MKARFLFSLCLVFYTSILFASDLKSNNLTLGIMPRDAPPSIVYKDGILTGTDSDVVNAVAKRAGINIRITVLPWKRVQLMVKNGTLDGAAVGYRTAERERYGIYTDTPINYVSYSIFVKNGQEFSFNRVDDLYGKRVGKPEGFQVYLALDVAAKEGSIDLYEFRSRKTLISMLRLGRLDAIVTLSKDTEYELRLLGITDVVALPRHIQKPEGSYIWFSKSANLAPEVLVRFNHALKEMVKDGSLQEIYQKYGLSYLP